MSNRRQPTDRLMALQGYIDDLKEDIRSITDRVEAENRTLTEDEATSLKAKCDALEARNTELDAVERLGPSNDTTPDWGSRKCVDVGKPRKQTGYVGSRSGDDADFGFDSMTEFAGAVRKAYHGEKDERIRYAEQRTQSVGVGADGGFMVPTRFAESMWTSMAQQEPHLALLNRVVAQTVQGNTVIIPTVKDEDQSSDEAAGLAMTATAEGGTITADDLIFGQIEMNLTKYAVRTIASNELISDGIGFENALREGYNRSLRILLSNQILDGTGAGQLLGINVGGDLTTVSTSSGTGNILLDDVSEMASRLDPGADGSEMWIAHPGVRKALAKIRVSTTAGESLAWQSNVAAGSPDTLFGMPVRYSSSCQTLDTVGDLILGRWSKYLYVSTPPVMDYSPHERFSSDQGVWRFKLRHAGQPLRNTTFTDRASYTSANFVRLATRS